MQDPDATTQEFRRVFQSLIGFLNVVGVMNGSPPFDMDWQRGDGRELLTASYAANLSDAQSKAAPIQYNFQPTVLFEGEKLAIASTQDLAEQFPESSRVATSNANTLARLSVPVLRQILSDNSEHLIAQNMLEKGHSRQEAEAEIGLLMTLLSLLGDVDAKLAVTESRMELSADINLANTKSSAANQ